MNNIQAFFFDFDGVILESVGVKSWAFEELFRDYPKFQKQIVNYHMANGGVSRYVKFRHIYQEILKLTLTDEMFQNLCDQYSELVFNKVLVCEFVKGAKEFLDKYHLKEKFFIISGTPQDEMRSIVEKRGLSKYFKGVFGSPDHKGHWVKEIASKYSFDFKKIVFVGDALSDYEAAVENGCCFIARIPDGEDDIFKDKMVDYRIKDLSELEDVLKQGVLE